MPLLSPMSAIAGQLSVVVGSYHLLKPNKGMGTLIGSYKDIKLRIVTVIGAGVAGTEAIEKALANKSHVKVIDLSLKRDLMSWKQNLVIRISNILFRAKILLPKH